MHEVEQVEDPENTQHPQHADDQEILRNREEKTQIKGQNRQKINDSEKAEDIGAAVADRDYP